jgi:hypothetical protein
MERLIPAVLRRHAQIFASWRSLASLISYALSQPDRIRWSCAANRIGA